MPLEKGTLLFFPGSLTHLYKITVEQNSNEVLLLNTKLSRGHCTNEIHGTNPPCPGFDEKSNKNETEKQWRRKI